MQILHATMGRSAVFGPSWTPSSIMARKMQGLINEGSTMVAPAWQPVAQRGSQPQSPQFKRSQSAATEPTSPGGFHFFRDPAANSPTASRRSLLEDLRRELPGASNADGEESRAVSKTYPRFKNVQDPPKMAWGTMLGPRKDLGARQASAPLLSSSTPSSPQSRSSPKYIPLQESKQQQWLGGQAGSQSYGSPSSYRPTSAPDGPTAAQTQGNSSTNVWRASELSVGRDSLNCIINRSHLDVPKSLQRQTSMSRTAMMRTATRGSEQVASFR